MDAIKKFLSPGQAHDDKILYEDPNATSSTSGSHTAGATQSESVPTHSTQTGTEKKEQGVLNQILHPGADKQTSSTGASATSAADPAHRADTTGQAEHANTHSLLHNDRDQYDQQRHGVADQSTSSATGAPTSSTTQTYPQQSSSIPHGLTGNARTTSYDPYSTASPADRAAAASAASGIAAGGLASQHQHGDESLSHHVHNGLTDLHPRKPDHDYNVASANTLRGAGNATDATPVSHISAAAPVDTQGETGMSHKVYNTVVGKHGEHEHQSESHHHHHDASHGISGPAGASTGLTAGSSLPGQQTSSTAQSSTLPIHSSTERSTGHGAAAGAVGGSAAAIAAQHAANRHNTHSAGFGAGDHHSSSTSADRNLARSDAGQSSSTTAPHSSSLLNKLDPRVKTDSTTHEHDQHHHDRTNTEHDRHHHGRDAALAGGAGAAGVGAYEANKHHHDTTGAHHSSTHDNASSTSTTAPHSSSLLNKLDPRVKTDSTSTGHDQHHHDRTATATEHDHHHHGRTDAQHDQHHYGRDAALVGGTGVGAYEANKHHHDSTGTGHSSSRDATSSSTSTTAPHNSSLLNKLDPRVKTDATQTEHHSHHGRDAALVGGTGAAGVGAYEAHKHHDHSSAAPYSSTSGHHDHSSAAPVASTAGHHDHSSTAPYSSSTGHHDTTGSSSTTPHNSALLNKLDPRVKTDSTHTEHSSHHGRDATLAGGAGVGAYEASRHHDATSGSAPITSTHGSSATNTSTTAPHSSNLANKLDPRVKTDSTHPEHKDHHHGRDAAAVGGLGAAGAGIWEADKHHHDPSAYTQPTVTGSATSAIHETGHRTHDQTAIHETGHRTHDPTTSSTGDSSKPGLLNKLGLKSDPAEKAAKHEHREHEHHTGRDAALVGGSAAAVGAAAHEHGRSSHHGATTDHTRTQGTPYDSTVAGTAPNQHGTSSTTDPAHKPGLLEKLGLKHDKTDASSHPEHSSHHGRDAAVVGGTGAALGAGAHHADKHHHTAEPTHHHTSDTTSHHGGRDAALVGGAGAAGLGAYEADKHHHHGTTPTSTSSHTLRHTEPTSSTSHHGGRDAALLGGAGAAGVGAYEADKHHHHHHDTTPTSTSSHTLRHTEPTSTTSHHGGRDAAILGGAGAAGVGAYEADKHHHHGTTSTTGSLYPQDTTTTGRHSHHDTTTGHHSHHDTATGHHDAAHHDKENKPGLLTKLGLKHDKTAETSERDSHKGRDAALVGGSGAAIGAGAYEAHKHHDRDAAAVQATHPTTAQHHTSHHADNSTAHHSHSKHDDHATHHGHSTHDESANKPGLLSKLGLKQDKTHEHTDKETHHGRDAALVGGSGAALGAGAYEAEHHHGQTHPSGSTSTPGQSSTTQTGRETHLGRDAALVGGSGAALGAGAYEAEHHHGQTHPSGLTSTTGQPSTTQTGTGLAGGQQYTGPATQTIGPHSSNIANILDPRVKPEPALMKQREAAGYPDQSGALGAGALGGAAAGGYAAGHPSTVGHSTHTGAGSSTVGPHSSNTANVIDPRVQQNQTLQGQHHHTGEHHTGSGLTGAGAGAGAGALGHESHGQHTGTTEIRHGIAVSEDEHHHNKLHKEPKEKKEGFLSKLIHGNKHSTDETSPSHLPGSYPEDKYDGDRI